MSARAKHFLRHFLEMLAAMLVGMAVAHPLVGPLTKDGRALAVLVMAFGMIAPMAAWMRHRRNDWPRVAEMSAAMLLPALALAGLAEVGIVQSGRTALDIQHGVTVPDMLAAMLLRRDVYQRSVAASSAPGTRSRVKPLCGLLSRGTARATSKNL